MSARTWPARVRLLAALLGLVALGATLWSARSDRAVAAPAQVVALGLYENPPKVYTDERGRPAGLFVELIEAVAKAEGWQLKYVPCEWADCLQLLSQGGIDLMPDVAYTDERSRRFDFHAVSVASSWSQVYGREDLRLQSLADLGGRRVAVLRGGVQEGELARLMAEAKVVYEPVQVETLAQGYEAVSAGRADAVVTNSFSAARRASAYRLRETPLLFLASNLYFATAKGRHPELLARIDARLSAWRADPDSIYFDAMRRALAPPQAAVIAPWVLWTLVGGGAVLLLSLGSSVVLRWKVAQRTAALARTSARLDQLLEASPVVLYLRDGEDPAHRIEWVSANLERVFGFAADAARAPGWWPSRLHADDRSRVLGAVAARAPRGSLEYRIVDAQGRVRHLRDEWRPLAAGDGTVAGRIVGSWSDLTESREQAAHARESEQRFVTMLRNSPVGIALGRLGDRRVVEVNEAFTTLVGHPREELLGRRVSELDIWVDPAQRDAIWAALEAGESVRQQEASLRRRDGERFDVSYSAVRIVFNGEPHMLASLVDITAQRRAQRMLADQHARLERLVAERTAQLTAANRALELARDEAEDAVRAKSAFLANMSHEIRTPMNAVLGTIYLMRRAGVTPQQGEQLDTIVASSRHLLGIIDDILDLSKIEAGRLQMERAPLRVADITNGVASMVAARAAEKGLALVVDNEPMAEPLLGDPTRLTQALLNYATNAIKFTERGGLTLRARRVADDAESVLVRFEVQDTGIGIAPEAAARLFTAFEQADSSTTRRFGGTGLGLAITRRLAELSGGEAGLDSEPGRGSTFWFTARLGRSSSAFAPAAAPESMPELEWDLTRQAAGQRVLLAEDDAVNRLVALEVLRHTGLVVDVAENGAQAVQMAEQRQGGEQPAYALILMDVQMPQVDGLEATRRIRRLAAYRDTPIVALTANVFAEDRERCRAAGMDDFLSKPFDPDSLFTRLSLWLHPDAPARPTDAG